VARTAVGTDKLARPSVRDGGTPQASARKQQAHRKKQGNKNSLQTQRRLEAQMEDIQAKLARIKGQQPTQQEPAEELAVYTVQ